MKEILSVATIAPMKRGLKEQERELREILWGGSNHCPDEKGTESYVEVFGGGGALVATIAPMKRGLKVTHWINVCYLQ